MVDLQDGYALGLDLGTTYSCIGVYRNGGVEIIPNRNGDRTTPSIVTIDDTNTILKGEEALDHLVKNYDSSIYAIKRFIGRKYNDEKVKEEIKLENFPFKIIGDNGNMPLVLIDKNKQHMQFTLEEISSFVIRKMVDSAEAYLGKKVNNLVITVPANFNDAQRNCTKQAAKLAGVNVLRIINEPTAAALAYGLGQNNEGKEKKILVFDLGGGTFDVTILKINKGEEQNFEIMSTKGDKFLGGEDFDNKLVEEVLDRFCNKMKESKEIIKKDKKALKRLKISCESIKRVLSNNEETNIVISNFYNNNDIMETITRNEFENLCADLFDKLQKPLEEALLDAKLKKDEIKEIVLVGGSSRIPKIKTFLKTYFNIPDTVKKKKNTPENEITVINDTINPDEAIAYGATVMAAKILLKKDSNLSNFRLFDITPLSLGINVKNNSSDPEIQKEGNLMSVIIKRGSKIPLTCSKTYETACDNQSEASIIIFEGEKKYTKYNHILGRVDIKNIPQKKKGEVKFVVQFFIDVNGILSVTTTEKASGQSINTTIKNDNVGLTEEDIQKIMDKNKVLLEKKKTKGKKELDYGNLKESLREFQDAYEEAEEEDDKYEILKNYNEELELFINSFDKNFDNETMAEKYYIYVKELLNSYKKLLEMKDQITRGDQEDIVKNIKEYIKVFAKQGSGYLDNLMEIMKDVNKKIFYEIVIIAIEELNNCGKNCLEQRKKFCKYNSLKYFEKAIFFFKKYIIDFKALTIIKSRDIRDKCKSQVALSESYINDINSNAILLSDNSLKHEQLIKSQMTGFTNNILGLRLSPQDEQEKYQIVLRNYEKMLIELPKNSKEKALCIANIIKIGIRFLGESNYKKYMKLAQECEFIVGQLNLDKNADWYKDFNEIYQEIKENYNLMKENEKEMRDNIKLQYKDKFDEIENKFTKKKNNLEFINYILKLVPYKEYEEDKKNNKIDFSKESQELIKYLQSKYHPDQYEYSDDDEQSQLKYLLVEYVEAYLNRMFSDI